MGWGKERGRHRSRSRLQALSCRHRARREVPAHELWDHDLAEVGRLTDCATPAPWLLKFFNVYFWERDRECTGEVQKERETQKPKQAPGSELLAQSLTQSSNSWTARSWSERSWMLNWLSHLDAPILVWILTALAGPHPFAAWRWVCQGLGLPRTCCFLSVALFHPFQTIWTSVTIVHGRNSKASSLARRSFLFLIIPISSSGIISNSSSLKPNSLYSS